MSDQSKAPANLPRLRADWEHLNRVSNGSCMDLERFEEWVVTSINPSSTRALLDSMLVRAQWEAALNNPADETPGAEFRRAETALVLNVHKEEILKRCAFQPDPAEFV